MPKKSLILATLAVSLILAAAFWKLVGHDYLEKVQESEALTNIASIMTAEKAYHDEYGTYSADFLAIGYSLEGELRADVYLTQEDLPKEYGMRLKEEELPMISKDSYRIVAILKKNSKIFIQENGKPLKRINPTRIASGISCVLNHLTHCSTSH